MAGELSNLIKKTCRLWLQVRTTAYCGLCRGMSRLVAQKSNKLKLYAKKDGVNHASRFMLSYMTTPWTQPLGEMWLLLIKMGSTSGKQEICQCSPPSIFTPLHTLILRTDPPIFPLPDLSLIFIILSNAPDSASQTLPAPLPVQYHPHQTHTHRHTPQIQNSPFVKQTVYE